MLPALRILQHDVAYGNLKNKALREKPFNIAKNSEYDGYQRRLTSMAYLVLVKKSTGTSPQIGMRINLKTNNYQRNHIYQLLENLKYEKHIHPLWTTFVVQI